MSSELSSLSFSRGLTPALLSVLIYQEYHPEEVRWAIQGHLPGDLRKVRLTFRIRFPTTDGES